MDPTQANYLGDYEINIILSVSNSKTQDSFYSFKLSIINPNEEKLPTNDSTNTTNNLEVISIDTHNNVGLYANIFKITMTGEMTILFSDEIIVPQKFEKFGPNHLNIFIFTENPPKLNGTKLNWEVTEMNQISMKIQLHFSNPSLISNE